jgi:Outer membrane protein beta-barrel domain
MMMKKILVVVLFAGASYQSWGQKAAPAQTLRLATSTYEQGRLHELEGILGNIEGFSKEQKVAAYKLLTQAYIYLEEPKKADTTMLKLLATDNYFAINKEIDPAEFVALYNTFRTDPVFAVGLKGGFGVVQPAVMTDFYVTAGANGTGTYKYGSGILGGFFFEKKIKGKITFVPEILISTRAFSDESSLSIDDLTNEPTGLIQVGFNQTWLDLNLVGQYKINNGSLNPYIGAGPAFGYNLKSTIAPITTGPSEVAVSGPDISISSSTKKILYSFLIVGGFKYRIGEIFVGLEARYQYGINIPIDFDTRSNLQSILDYGYQLNDYKTSTATIAVNVSRPFFKPMKTKKK